MKSVANIILEDSVFCYAGAAVCSDELLFSFPAGHSIFVLSPGAKKAAVYAPVFDGRDRRGVVQRGARPRGAWTAARRG